jgi:hypothetical protein
VKKEASFMITCKVVVERVLLRLSSVQYHMVPIYISHCALTTTILMLGICVAPLILSLNVALTRREVCYLATASASTGVLLPSAPAEAVQRGGVQWSIDLPPSFEVSRQLSSIVRVRKEAVLTAEDPSTGAQVRLLCLPLGQQAGASLDAMEQLSIADYFLGQKDLGDVGGEEVANIMSASAARSPGIISLRLAGAPARYTGGDGRRYVRYGYEAEKCSGEFDGGECFGSSTKRSTLATVTVSSISQYRTNTERERMRELGQERNVNVLWLLTLSTPSASWAALEPLFQKVSSTLLVPTPSGPDA